MTLNASSKLDNVLKLGHPCRCRSCENSCNFGSGSLADGELKKVAEHLGISEDDAKKDYFEEITRFSTTRLRPKLERKDGNPYGKCIFYENGCKIHEVKPLECKIAMGCKEYGEELIVWFHLNHFLDRKNMKSLREFKNYLESGGKTLPGAEFKDVFDDKMLKKIDEYEDLKDDTDWEEKLGMREK